MAVHKLKVDFHTHTAEDPQDLIKYTARDLIDEAARLGFDALAVANHGAITYSPALKRYAAGKNVLLIPGVEITASRSHVLVINPQFEPKPRGHSLSDIRDWQNEASLIIAPHPFFDIFKSLRSAVYPLLPYLDAIEYTSYHNRWLDLNKKAVRIAREFGKPVVGVSDCHLLWMFGTTYTLVEAEKDIQSIVAAVKKGRCEVRTEPLSLYRMIRFFVNVDYFRKILGLYERRKIR